MFFPDVHGSVSAMKKKFLDALSVPHQDHHHHVPCLKRSVTMSHHIFQSFIFFPIQFCCCDSPMAFYRSSKISDGSASCRLIFEHVKELFYCRAIAVYDVADNWDFEIT